MAQQKRPNLTCPRCGLAKMRSGQQAGEHGKVDGVRVCDDCFVDATLSALINDIYNRKD